MIKKSFLVVLAAFSYAGAASAFSSSTVGNATTFAPTAAASASGISFASDGTPIYRQSKSMPVPGGTLPIDVSAPLNKQSTASALGRFAKKALPLASTGFAIYELAKDLGFTWNEAAGGLSKADPNVCTSAPCTELMLDIRYGVMQQSQSTGWHKNREYVSSVAKSILEASTPADPCIPGEKAGTDNRWETMPYTGGQFQDFRRSIRSSNAYCSYGAWGSLIVSFQYFERQIAPTEPVYIPATEQEFADAIANQSGWPTSDAFREAVKDAIKSGEAIQTDTPTVTGPATQQVATSTTTNTTNNTTKVTTTTNNYTYEGSKVTVTQTTVSQITNNTTGETSTETTTDEKPLDKPFEMPCGVSGVAPCNVKVDETGTAAESTASSRFDTAKTDLEQFEQRVKDALGPNGDARQIEATPWTWTFQLPTGCSPYPLQPFGMTVDVCQFQDVIHDLMALLWIGAGIFGILGLLRDAFGNT